MDKLLRAAEQEAAEIRAAAEQRAGALLTQVHHEIDRQERERHAGWQAREAALVEAEQQGSAELAAVRKQADALRADAQADAQRVRGHAYNRAKEITDAAAETAAQAVREAAVEVERLHQVGTAARAEIERLLRTLDGIRSALAYDLDAGTAYPPTSRASAHLDGVRPDVAPVPANPANSPTPRSPSPAAATLGQRRGDLRRARLAGLAAPPSGIVPEAAGPVD